MIKLRSNTFETNSSSSHSLVFSKKDRGHDYNLPVDENGVLTISFGEYGWGPDILGTPMQKLSYYFTDNSGWRYSKDISWDTLIKEIMEMPAIKEVVEIIKKKCPQVKSIELKPSSSYFPAGYVDHQSVGTSRGTDPERLIFDNSVIIVIDNDNGGCYLDYTEPDDPENALDVEELFNK